MNRGLWFVAGAGAGIYAVIRGRRAAEALTLDGMGDRIKALALGARMFREEVATGRAEAETGLREHFGALTHVGELEPGPGSGSSWAEGDGKSNGVA